MMAVGKKMKLLDEEIARLNAEIARLQARREGVIRAKELLSGGQSGGQVPPTTPEPRKRATNIKPLILDLMKGAGNDGATSAQVAAAVREQAPAVAKDTVGSVLSRLKADGALVYDGERYYDARFAPKAEKPPFDGLKAVV